MTSHSRRGCAAHLFKSIKGGAEKYKLGGGAMLLFLRVFDFIVSTCVIRCASVLARIFNDFKSLQVVGIESKLTSYRSPVSSFCFRFDSHWAL